MRKILASKSELNLKMMLEGGQSFRWKETALGEWTGVMLNFVWVIKQYDNHIEYEIFKEECVTSKENKFPEKLVSNSLNSSSEQTNLDNVLMDYLRLHDSVNNYYEEWSKKDKNFSKIAYDFSGIRILNQEPTENLFSFICSSNNNIKRITGMVNKLCELYGSKIAHLNGINYYSFPTVNALSQSSVEMDLRNAGFGYRARYVSESAKLLCEWGGEKFLDSLKLEKYNDAKDVLMKLPGIGAKVADCVCLMSLGHLEAVPVDTHVFKIASEIYLPHLRKVKSVTGKIYDEIGDHFRQLYGSKAGWAHAVLFCADLKMFGNDKKRKAPANNFKSEQCTNIKGGKTKKLS